MTTVYMGKAPLTLVPTIDGSAHYVYAGRQAPQGIEPEALARFLDEGFLVEADVDEFGVLVPLPVVDPLVEAGLVRAPRSFVDEPFRPTAEVRDQLGTVPGVEQPVVVAQDEAGQPVAPARTATKGAWVAYRAAQHGEQHRAALEGFTKPELQDDDTVAAEVEKTPDADAVVDLPPGD